MSANTWEAAVRWLREQPEQAELVRDAYFDDPLIEAAERFAQSAEWLETRRYLPIVAGKALDVGAGRGIASFALVRGGWQVTALEPDPSDLVGAGAIRQLAQDAAIAIDVVEEFGESLPFPDASFDLVYGRQVLHHAHDLGQLCREMARVLKPGGVLIAAREHVISQPSDLPKFLAKHPLHHRYGGEHAYRLAEYQEALQEAGLHLRHTLSHWESAINYFPATDAEQRERVLRPLVRRVGAPLAQVLAAPGTPWGKAVLERLTRAVTARDNTPGRLYSFIAHRPLG